MNNLLQIGTKFKVAIVNLEGYMLDGVQNGDVGEVIAYSSGWKEDEILDDEYFVTIRRQDGTLCEGFLIDAEDMEIIND